MGGKGSKACPEVGNIIEAMVFDNEGKSQGFVILEIRRLFGPGEHGRFILGDYVTASDSFYRFWMESDGSMSRVDGYYHLCRGNAPECDVKPRGGDEVVHLGKWRTLKEEELNPTVLPHFTGEARGELARFHKQATPPSPEGGGGGLPWSAKKPAGLKIRKDKPGEGARDVRKKPAGLPEDEGEADDTSTTGLRKQLEALKKRLADKEAEEDAGKARKKRRTDKERKDRDKPPDRGVSGFPAVALGKGARVPGSPPSDPSSDDSGSERSKGGSDGGDKRRKEKDRKEEKKRSRSRKRSKDRKEKESPKEKKTVKKKRKKKGKKEKDKGPFGLSRTEEWSKAESSMSSGSTGSSDSKEGFRKASGGMDHHLRLVAYAKKRPGRLAVRLLRKMGQAVGFSSGANLLRSPTMEGAVPASAHLFYMAVMTPQLAGKWSPRSQRELKYWATVLDLLVEGQVAQVADIACQRVKALEKSIHDGNNWRRARFLELVEPEDLLLIDRGEERMMTKELEHEERHRPKGTWHPWERTQKGDPKGKGKGHKGDDREGKGAGKKRTPAENAAGAKDDKGKGH